MQTDIYTYTRTLQCNHASVGLGQPPIPLCVIQVEIFGCLATSNKLVNYKLTYLHSYTVVYCQLRKVNDCIL